MERLEDCQMSNIHFLLTSANISTLQADKIVTIGVNKATA